MPKANTYRAERMLGEYGFAVTDVYVVNGNNRSPVVFKKIGDSIDLNKVGIKTMVKSVLSGQLGKLLVSGVLSTTQQEVSLEKENEIKEALADFGVDGYNDQPMATPVKYRTLEPGVTVAVSHVPERPKQVEIIQPVAEALTVQLEPGLVAPTGAMAGQQVQALEAGAEVEARPKGGKKSKKVAEAPVEQKNPHEDWKFNLDFQTQKRTIVDSTDKEFLAWVVANDDSVQFQKLAKTRLAEG